jgi:sulfite reductase alpha subunit-like flavoprotein
LLADYPLPESLNPIPDDVQLPPKYPVELLSTMGDTDHHDSVVGSSLAEDECLFLASKTKSADRSHIDNPQTTTEKAREDWVRLNAAFPADLVRRDGVFERDEPRAFDTMDKSNRLKDHPEKYLLERQHSGLPDCPPEDLLPIPDTCVGRLLHHTRVTPPDHWQDVRHLAFDLDVGKKALPNILDLSGSLTLVIWPKNYPEDVDELILQMGWEAEADAPLQLRGVPPGLYAKGRVTTLRHLLTHNLDITAVPKRSFIKGLLHFTKDERERERLMELVESGNEQEFYDYTCRPRRTILELLRDFTGVKIPYNRVLDMFPAIRGREFSVCNGGASITETEERDHVRIEILVALVEYKTIIRKPRQGLCSRYLKRLPVGTRLTVRLKSSSSHLVRDEVDARRPLIAIATGTGVAPIRAVIQERDCYSGAGDTLLFFGSRNRSADFHFAHEWRLYPNLRVFPAFSRDSIEPDPKTTATTIIPPPTDPLAIALETVYPDQYDAHKNYVQHLIRAHAAEVGALMRRRPYVLICGSNGRMPISVRNALLDALVIDKVCENKEAAEKWLSNPRNVSMWQETW